MLQLLSIRNYAIITSVDIGFAAGLNIITGETGAGKSILMGALGLILGERADSSVLLDKEKKCVIEGTFRSGHPEVKDYLKENDLEPGSDEIMIRREIAASGKSRAFINDIPVNLSQLKELSSLLVDLHQQFDTLELSDNDFQREVIDALAGQASELAAYREFFRRYAAEKKMLEEWKQQQAAANRELDYHQFLFDELEEAGFVENELESTEADLKLMANAENIKTVLSRVHFEMEESEQPLVQQIKSISNQLHALAAFHGDIELLVQRLHSAQVELQDIAGEVDRLNDSVSLDPARLEQMNERLALGYRLLKKHNVQTTGELLNVKQELQQKLEVVMSRGDNISKKQEEIDALLQKLEKLAAGISTARKKQLRPFEEKVNKILARVGMPNARIKVEVKERELYISGREDIEVLFDANRTRFEPLRKVASGGELSRLMLAIKSLVARSVQLPTLIFDEIDTGISGEAARQVGIIMKELSQDHQVLAITHQPQIAAKASNHYFVYKEIKEDRILTAVKLLNADERIRAIATMLSGEKPTAAAFENAREMISN